MRQGQFWNAKLLVKFLGRKIGIHNEGIITTTVGLLVRLALDAHVVVTSDIIVIIEDALQKIFNRIPDERWDEEVSQIYLSNFHS